MDTNTQPPKAAASSSPVECPHCHNTFGVNVTAHVPEEQVIYMAMEGTGVFFAADTIGKQICNMEKLIKSVAESTGARVAVFLKSVEIEPHKIKLGFLTLDAPLRTQRNANQGNK